MLGRLIWCLALAAVAGCGTAPAVLPARVVAVAGEVTVEHQGAHTRLEVKRSASLDLGDGVETGPKSQALVEARNYVTYVRENSRLVYERPPGSQDGPMKVQLLRGLATFVVPKADRRDYRFEAATGTVIAAVKGTEFTLETAPDGATSVRVYAGSIDLLAPGDRAVLSTLAAGETATVPGASGALDKKTLSPAEHAQEKERHTAMSLIVEALLTGIDVGTH